jgi:hypothetical protein
MNDEVKTQAEVEAANRRKAVEVNEARNRSRVDRLAEIADNNEAMRAGEMVETDEGNLKLKDSMSDEARREAEAAREAEEAEQALAEMQARQLQEEGSETATDPGEQDDTSQARVEAEVEKEQTPSDVKVVNGETYYLTVVNGNEKWLTLSQLRAAAQKVESADQYLAAAAESVRNASRLDLSPKRDEPSKVEDVDLEKTLSSAVMGDQEAIKKLASVFKDLKEVRAKPSEVTPDVLQQIDERWSFRRAAEWFDEEYQDLLTDPFLKELVYKRDSELANSQPKMPYKQRLKTAGDEIRGWIQKRTGAAGVKVVPSETKAERKKTLVNVPSAAARQTPVNDEEAEESVEEVIQKMAKARGQARAMVHRPAGQR